MHHSCVILFAAQYEVRDRGAGMSPGVLAQALLTFYSTQRSGTGLGLVPARETRRFAWRLHPAGDP